MVSSMYFFCQKCKLEWHVHICTHILASNTETILLLGFITFIWCSVVLWWKAKFAKLQVPLQSVLMPRKNGKLRYRSWIYCQYKYSSTPRIFFLNMSIHWNDIYHCKYSHERFIFHILFKVDFSWCYMSGVPKLFLCWAYILQCGGVYLSRSIYSDWQTTPHSTCSLWSKCYSLIVQHKTLW